MRNYDIAVVGGGVIGCAAAFYLARAGARVVVLERGALGGQATGAAAGMLAPLAEAHAPGPFLQLALAGLRALRAVADEVSDLSGVGLDLIPSGILRVAATPEEAAELRGRLNWQGGFGLRVEWLDAAALRQADRHLHPDVAGAIWSPDECHLAPARLVQAFARAAQRLGVELREGAPVAGFDTEGARITAVRLAGGERVPCGHVLLAAGAWTGGVASWLGAPVPVRPIRGQILSLQDPGLGLRRVAFGHTGYVVPKPDGSLVVGATEDEAGFQTHVTTAGLGRLLEMAQTLYPGLGGAPFRHAWAGLRPVSADGLPLIGPLPTWDNVTVASGHFRNGILLCAVTGELLAGQLAGPAPADGAAAGPTGAAIGGETAAVFHPGRLAS